MWAPAASLAPTCARARHLLACKTALPVVPALALSLMKCATPDAHTVSNVLTASALPSRNRWLWASHVPQKTCALGPQLVFPLLVSAPPSDRKPLAWTSVVRRPFSVSPLKRTPRSAVLRTPPITGRPARWSLGILPPSKCRTAGSVYNALASAPAPPQVDAFPDRPTRSAAPASKSRWLLLSVIGLLNARTSATPTMAHTVPRAVLN
mmetsp:Transcript_29860/g.69009  ORF Transcript_29860/g.69009 Transcript_29860/m.69009 type:complete len:208 (+) Transcript_29860:569-1192(+)